MGERLSPGRDALRTSALTVAPRLLGAILLSEYGGAPVSVRVTEVEAYTGEDDPASHSFRGPTGRNAVMFGEPGHLYVYFTYGMHWCVNVVCGPSGVGSAVLLRAGEIVDGLPAARARRTAARRDVDLARGPARLASALALDRTADGADLLDPRSPVRLSGVRTRRPRTLASGPRVGITAAAERPWRFWLDGDPTVSAFKPGRTKPRPPRAAD